MNKIMRKLQLSIAGTVLVSMLAMQSSTAYAAAAIPSDFEFIADAPAKPPVKIDDATLSKILFAENTDIVRATNAVMRARDQVNVSRGSLLPSLNLSFALALTVNPTFLINSASCLIPFLFPTNWFNLRANKRSYHAEIQAFRIARLNLYAMAHSTMLRVENDMETIKILEEQYMRLKNHIETIELAVLAGLAPKTDLILAKTELNSREASLSKARQVIVEERAAIRKMLALDLDETFTIDMGVVSPSKLEGKSAISSIDAIVDASPEKEQLEMLHQAAKATLRSAKWAFLSGCSGQQGSMNNETGTTFNWSTGTSIGLGFGYFPMVKIARRNVSDVENRQVEMKLELSRQLESALSAATEAAIRMGLAEKNYETTLELEKQTKEKYALGLSRMSEVLDAFNRVQSSRVDLNSAKFELDGHRITLKRMNLEDKFKEVLEDSKKIIDYKKKKK